MKQLILLLSLCFLAPLTSAHDVQPEGLVTLQASASQEVETDTMQATLAVEAENYDPATLAKNINKKMAWAIKTAKPYPSVKLKGGHYTTHQLYNKRIFKAWRGSQTITLESKNSEDLGKLIALLQKELLVKSIRYHVSKEKRQAVTKALMQQAIDNFKEKAQIVTKGFDKNKFVIHQININDNNNFRPYYQGRAHMKADVMRAESAPVNLQQNTSNIQININGSIRIIK